MTEIIKTLQAESCPQVWVKAIQHLVDCPDQSRFNLSLAVESPDKMSKSDKHVTEIVDNFLISHGEKPLATVAGTIFPANYYLREGSAGVFESFPSDYAELGPQPGSWGSYAMRMLRRESKNGTFNPLKELIGKLQNNMKINHSSYEINVIDDEMFELPLYRTASDYKRHMRQPCLSHITFKVFPGRKLTVSVMYRSHFYMTKALGNLLGLAQLQSFVASESGLGIGPLVCHSTHARVKETGIGKIEIRNLIADCLAA